MKVNFMVACLPKAECSRQYGTFNGNKDDIRHRSFDNNAASHFSKSTFTKQYTPIP